MRKFVIIIACLNLITGCGVAYNMNMSDLQKNANDEDYGNPPPKNYKQIAENYIRDLLKDPDSAKFRNWKEPYRCLYPSNTSMTMPQLGWCNYVEVNAKNGFGAYNGFSLWQIRWSNEQIYGYYKYRIGKYGNIY